MSDSGGLDFNFTFAPGVSLEQQIGFEIAGEFWSQQLADNATINIFVEREFDENLREKKS
ncbi:MAG: hypothetical protein AB4372_03535 [Xenococcus sp. (in: cyanobacteria)]